MMDNIIKAYLHGKTVCKTAPVYQYNSGMVLELVGADLPANYRADFSNSEHGTSKAVLGTGTTVSVPYEYFVPGATIHCWIVLSGDDYTVTKLHIMIPVDGRARPTDEEPTPDEQNIIDQAITALNEAVSATGQDVIDANAAKEAAQEAAEDAQTTVEAILDCSIARVSSLDSTALAKGSAIEAVGIPVYVNNVSQYAAYGITDKGWYVFARVVAPAGASVTAQTIITGAAGYIAAVDADHVDVAVRFGTTAQSVPVTINWGTETDHFTFKASDLAVRNLDYRVTFYIYDISPYCVWTYALTTDTTFVANKQYYTKDENDVYTLAEVTAGDAVPADTYYNHSKLTFSGMTPNVTYKLDTIVDCPIEIVLPEVADDGHGAWFEIQMRYDNTYSCTLLPPEGVKVGTATTQAQNGGINTIDLQYTIAGDVKMWTLLNTHSNIPA